MNRRLFLSALGGAAFTATSLRGLLAAFAAPDCEPPSAGAARVAEALRQGAAAGTSVLVLVVPENQRDDTAFTRGRDFGALFYHGSAAALAALAQYTLVAARASEVATVVPGVMPGPAWLIELDTSTLPVVARVAPEPAWRPPEAAATPAPARRAAPVREDDPDDPEDRVIDRRLEDAAAALLRFTDPLPAARAARAERLAALHGADRVRALRATPRDKRPPVDVLALAAIVVGWGAEDEAQVAAAARAALTSTDIPGAWRSAAGGCGSRLLSPPPDYVGPWGAIPCGMGHVPAKASIFLDFYVIDRAKAPQGG